MIVGGATTPWWTIVQTAGGGVFRAVDLRCINCGEPLPGAARTGLFARLLCWLKLPSRPSHTRRKVKQATLDRTTKYVWTDRKTGEEHTATTLDALPPEVRRQMEAARTNISPDQLAACAGSRFVFRDASSGEQRMYRSLEEMPADREAFECFQRKHGGLP